MTEWFRTSFAVAAMLGLVGLVSAQTPTKPASVGDQVAEFTVTDLTGKSLTLSELQKTSKSGQKRVVVLTF